MSETPMVEAVARAICIAEGIDPDRCDEALSARGGSPQWRYEIGAARAAIRAMRDAEFRVADRDGVIHEVRGEPMAVWRFLCDAALAPSPTP